jgi:hypothetical protein
VIADDEERNVGLGRRTGNFRKMLSEFSPENRRSDVDLARLPENEQVFSEKTSYRMADK